MLTEGIPDAVGPYPRAMQLCLLGPLEVRIDGRLVPLRSGLPRKLLVTLALHLGERVSADSLTEALWGQGA